MGGCCTGQERRVVPGALHTACTIEMASLASQYDVAVIDEVQVCAEFLSGSLAPWIARSAEPLPQKVADQDQGLAASLCVSHDICQLATGQMICI